MELSKPSRNNFSWKALNGLAAHYAHIYADLSSTDINIFPSQRTDFQLPPFLKLSRKGQFEW
jgi:hypothetical protein